MKGLLDFWCRPETACCSKSLLYTSDQETEKLTIYISKATSLRISAWLSLNEVPWGFCFAWCPCQTASMNRSYQRKPLRSTHQIQFNLCFYAHCLSSHWPLLGSGSCWLVKVREDCSLSSLRWQHKGADVGYNNIQQQAGSNKVFHFSDLACTWLSAIVCTSMAYKGETVPPT